MDLDFKSAYNYVYHPNGYTPLFQTILAFAIGIIFSPFSRGIIFLVITILLFELWYCWSDNEPYGGINRALRPGLILWAFFGFLVGRTFVSDDWNPIRCNYDDSDSLKDDLYQWNQEIKDYEPDQQWS